MIRACEDYRTRYFNMVSNIPCIYFEIDSAGIIQNCSNLTAELFGIDESELSFIPFSVFMNDEIEKEYFSECISGKKTAKNHEFAVTDRTGNEIILRAECLNHLSENLYTFIAVDVTDAAAEEEKNLLMNEKFSRLINEKSREMSVACNELENLCAVIAHEFKAPIRAIGLYNDVISEELSENVSDDTVIASFKIKEYCDKSLNLIENLLEYSKVKSHTVNRRKISMTYLVKNCLRDLTVIHSKSDIRVTIGNLPDIYGDEFLLKRAVYNILENSIKYSSQKPFTEIDVSCTEDDDSFTFLFRDNGAGFDASSVKADPFEMFSRLHTDEIYKGSGVGLATVMNIVKKHDGEVSIEAEPDNGCSVSLKFRK